MDEIFPNVIGHEAIKKRIFSILNSENVPNAFLFSGKEGVGKFNFALEIIKYLNTKNSDNPDYAIEQISKLREPYVNYVFPLPRGKNESANLENPYGALDENTLEEIRNELEKKIENPYYELNIPSAQNIKISSIRAIKKHLSVNKKDIPYSAIIIDKAEQMSIEAQNSLLKSLEEPPEGVIFFLLTKDESLLLPTTRSRCWLVNFPSLNKPDIEKILVRYFGVDDETVKKISPFANGSVKEAAKFLEADKLELLDAIIDLLRQAIAQRYSTALGILNAIIEETSNDLELIVNLISLWLEDALANKTGFDFEYSYNQYKDTFIKFNRTFQNADIPTVINSLQKLSEAYKLNVSLKIILMNIILELSTLGNRQI